MIEITDINSSGNGVGRDDGMAVFIPYTLVGETVEWQAVSKEKNYVIGKAMEIVKKSPNRCPDPCPYYGKCGGCNLAHMKYEEQLKCKENIVKSAINRIGKVEAPVSPIIPAESTLGYRNKASFPVNGGKIGYYEEGTHNIVEIDSCPLLKSGINKVLKHMRAFVADKSNINHLVVRSTSGKTIVTLVTNVLPFPFEKELIECLAPLGVSSININLNTNLKVILGKKTINIHGANTIPYEILGNSFDVSPTAFLQVNDKQSEKLYSAAFSAVDFTGKSVIDAYCGIGTISLAIARTAKRVMGIEINPKAIENAKAAAVKNSISNISFFAGQCEALIPELIKKSKDVPVLTVDPPRSGIGAGLIQVICDSPIKEIVYVSCNPSTLARDISRLGTGGFAPTSITPLDMFPNTAHTECVVVLQRV